MRTLNDNIPAHDTIPNVTRIEWRHGEYHVHLSIALSGLPEPQSVLPLGNNPGLADTATYLTNLAETIGNLVLGDLSIDTARRHTDGRLRTIVSFTVYRPGAGAATVATAATELQSVLDSMLKQDQLTANAMRSSTLYD